MYTTIMPKTNKEPKSPFPAYSACLRRIYWQLSNGRTFDVLIFELLQKYAISFDEFRIVSTECEKKKIPSSETEWIARLMVKYGIKDFERHLMIDTLKAKESKSKEERITPRIRSCLKS